MMLLCVESKEAAGAQYHVVYILGQGQQQPGIVYCRDMGHMREPVQIKHDNPRICPKCRTAAGIPVENEILVPVQKPAPPGWTGRGRVSYGEVEVHEQDLKPENVRRALTLMVPEAYGTDPEKVIVRFIAAENFCRVAKEIGPDIYKLLPSELLGPLEVWQAACKL